MELRQLEYFLECAQRGSLTRAAEALYTTQPHVSQVIRALERELGVALFRRTGSGIVLTEDGERIRFYAENAVKNAALIRDTAADASGETLRIAANPSSRLAYLAEEFFCAKALRNMTLQYTECSIEQMMDLLEHRQYDLGFLFVPEHKRAAFTHLAQRRHLDYLPLLQSDLVLHCGPASPFFGRERVTPEELNGISCVQMEDDFFSLEELLTEHEAFRSGNCSLHICVRTNSDHLMLDMLRATDYCNIGSYWLRENRRAPDASQTLIEGFEGRVAFGCLSIDNRSLSQSAAAFLERLREKIKISRTALTSCQ